MNNKKNLPSKAGIIHLLPLILIGVVIFLAARYYLYLNYDLAPWASRPVPTKESNIVFEEGSKEGWKKFSGERCDDYRGNTYFSIEVPENWTGNNTLSDEQSSFQNYTFTSPEGDELNISCGDGYGGGGCSQAEQKIQLKDRSIQGCYEDHDDGKLINLKLAYLVTDSATFSFSSNIDSKQKETLSDILATFELTKDHEKQ